MDIHSLLVTGLVITAAVGFDFVNGFHDASNSIATIVATKVLKPVHAVLWAAFFNFLALFMLGPAVAYKVGSGMLDIETVTSFVILAGLLGAIAWGLITWWWGLPTSSTHALLGGYAGSAMVNNILHHGWAGAFSSVIASGWTWTLLFIVLAPVMGLLLAQLMMTTVMTIFPGKKMTAKRQKRFGHLQLFSSACLSLMHGSNDAQKTAGIIAAAMVAGGFSEQFEVQEWVLWVSYSIMALGTLAGGWRIVHTMGKRLTHISPVGGFCAESAAAASILFATLLHLPVSTTHTTTGAIIGVGAARNMKAVHWDVALNIAWAWILTIPGAAAISGLMMMGLYFLTEHS